ncbi:MAG: histone deacetylase [Thermoflexus sp.]|nr:histone deacetylase [Thermoflexus sp.]
MAIAYAFDPIFLEHDDPQHIERRDRLERILEVLRTHGVLDRITPLPIEPIPMERLTRVHEPAYVERVRRLAERGGGGLNFPGDETYVTPHSFEAARRAAGAVEAAVAAVWEGRARRAFALVRPPGHHAFPDHGEGFCLFNNIALGARFAREELGARRVMIVDFDLHHGNGTQAIFYTDPTVLYLSTHQWGIYPGSGHWREIGAGPGEGATINLPLPMGVGDRGFQQLFEAVIAPAAQRFAPELLLVSAGYDPHWGDPLGGLSMTVQGFAALTRGLTELADALCQGRFVFVLEGGYHRDALAYGVLAAFRLWLGHDDVLDPLGPPPRADEPSVENLIAQVRRLHRLEG